MYTIYLKKKDHLVAAAAHCGSLLMVCAMQMRGIRSARRTTEMRFALALYASTTARARLLVDGHTLRYALLIMCDDKNQFIWMFKYIYIVVNGARA